MRHRISPKLYRCKGHKIRTGHRYDERMEEQTNDSRVFWTKGYGKRVETLLHLQQMTIEGEEIRRM